MQDAVYVQKSRNPLLNPGGAAIRTLEISWNRLEEFLLGARGACVSLSRTSLRQTLVHYRTSGSFDLASSTIAQYFGQEPAYRLPPPLVDTSHITRCFYLFCFIYPRPKRQYLIGRTMYCSPRISDVLSSFPHAKSRPTSFSCPPHTASRLQSFARHIGQQATADLAVAQVPQG
ncbi:hypothetical protein BJX65DRAFT_87399 [Aspergillus insuetus]